MELNCLYDSDRFMVVHIAPAEPGEGFELIDKTALQSTYLTGRAAGAFRDQVKSWNVDNPTVDECEDLLAAYMELNAQPMRTH